MAVSLSILKINETKKSKISAQVIRSIVFGNGFIKDTRHGTKQNPSTISYNKVDRVENGCIFPSQPFKKLRGKAQPRRKYGSDFIKVRDGRRIE